MEWLQVLQLLLVTRSCLRKLSRKVRGLAMGIMQESSILGRYSYQILHLNVYVCSFLDYGTMVNGMMW